jgi:CheY-like chemotaxis protein
MPQPFVFAIGPAAATTRVRSILEPRGFTVDESLAAVPADITRYSATVIADSDSLAVMRRLAVRPLDDRPLMLYLASDGTPANRLAAFAAGADAVVDSAAGHDEIEAHLRVFERWNSSRMDWRARTLEARQTTQQLQIAYRQIELDLTIARRLQASFLPRSLPSIGPMRFGVSYRPCGQVGGDFYDVIRLDEHSVCFYVADAMGHGVPASLLTVFLKKAVQPKEVNGSTYRLVPPDEVLSRLNRDLIAQGLADLPFITMVYGLLNCRTGALQFARAAHPHPIFLPSVGEPEQWQTPGTLLGIFEAEYPQSERTIRAGDKLLLFTDGLTETGPDAKPVIAAALNHRGLPIQTLVERVSEAVLAATSQPDDFTLLGLEMLA